MLWKNLYRKGLMVVALGALLVLGACTFTVQPESATSEGEAPGSGMSEIATAAEFVLPNGTTCLFSGTGATVAFDGKRANYTCTPIGATASATQTLAILNEPIIAGPTEYLVDFATIAQTDGGFELHASEVITFTAWEIVLADGRVCLHAGFGATMGFDGKRLNYTCDKGDSTADEVGLMGELTNRGDGVWLAQIDEIDSDANGFTQLSSVQFPVAKISGAPVIPDGESEAVPEAEDKSSEIAGTTWQWVQTQYGDDSVLVPTDPTVYTLVFDGSGNVAVQLDCNSGMGTYTLDGPSLIFGPIASTLITCPEGSQATEFANDLAQVYSYVLQDGHLFLSLQLDSGIMEFAPVEDGAAVPTAEATEEAAAEAAAEATEEPTAEATEEPSEEATPEATEEPSEEAASSDLVGTTWQWVQTVYGDDSVLIPSDPSQYTLLFDESGQVAVQLDCNSGGGTYTVDGPSLTFGPIASTLMACPEGSQATEFANDLANVNSFVIQDGHLHLAIKLDTGIMEFAPAGEGAEATPAATEEPSEESASSDLVGTSWQWIQSIYEGDMVVLATDPSRYTLTFNADGSVNVQLDCNRGNGTYTVDGSNLTFGAITSTRMACPADSQDNVFSEDLAAVVSYVIADGNLHLTLSTDGVMEFSPVE